MSKTTRGKKANKKRSSTTYLTIILIVITVPFLFNAVNFYFQKTKLEAKKEELVKLINQEEEKKQLYLEELAKVGTPQYYEYLARKYLGFIYPSEKVLIVQDQQNK